MTAGRRGGGGALRSSGRALPRPRSRATLDFGFFSVLHLKGYGWIIDRPAAVVVVPMAPGEERVWLARVERVPTKTVSWELPGGGAEGSNDVVAEGLRELEEECGLVATGGARALDTVIEMAPGMGRFPHHVIVARGVVPKGARPVPQKQEGIVAVRSFTRKETQRLIARGEISVLATLSGLAASGWLST